MSHLRPFVLAIVCLAFTGPRLAWGDPAPAPATADYVEDPYAPHHTVGSEARLGTAIGFIYGERFDVLAVGASAAYGYRFGRLAIESELDYLALSLKGDSATRVGDGERLGALARFDVVRIGPHYVGGNSMVALYVEGGAAVAWNHWYKPRYDEAMRVVPDDSKRVEGQVGFGIQLDHRLQEPIGFPHRIGWFLGWRLGLSPHQSDPAVVCRGASCRTATPMPETSYTDRSMLFQSSLSVTW